MLSAIRDRLSTVPKLMERQELADNFFAELDTGKYTLQTDIPSLQLMKAGCFDRSYSARINTFEWESLYTTQPSFFGAFADCLASRYDFVLIDSRTGLTDISGICTALMPDTLIAVFTPNHQNVEGVLEVVRQASGYRNRSDDLRPYRVFPLVSRVELSELKLNDAWRFGDTAEDVKGYQPEFERLFTEIYGLTDCDLTAYFDEAQIQYVPYYAFGEKIAIRSEESAPRSIARSCASFAEILSTPISAWEYQAKTQEDISAVNGLKEIPWDEEWFASHRQKALIGLEKANKKTGAMEVRFSLAFVKASSSRRQLLEVARGAQITSGWQVGIVPDREDLRPKPSSDGIYAEIVDVYGSFNYWSLRQDGDFYLYRSLFENELADRVLLVDTRIVMIAEVLLYCKRLYERLSVSPRAEVRIALEHSGLLKRSLTAGDSRNLVYPLKPSEVDLTRTSTKVVLGRIESDLLTLVKHFTVPLFELFDFAHIEDSVYEDLIEKFRSGALA